MLDSRRPAGMLDSRRLAGMLDSRRLARRLLEMLVSTTPNIQHAE